MFKQTLLATAITISLAAPAFASHCPLDAKTIDNALQRTDLNSEQKNKVKMLRDKGMRLHNSGQHRKSEQILAEAMRTLLGSKLK